MSKLSPLMLELIEKRPLTAIKALSEMNARDVAEFFEVLPTHHAVSLMSRISAWSAATLIAEMRAVSGAGILSKLDYQTAASIIRVVPEAARDKLLEALPRRLRHDLTAALTYPTNSVGAKMSINIVVMMRHQTVGDAFSALRQIKRARSGVGFVVDESQRLLGVVNAEQLIQLPNESGLTEVMDPSVKPLSARASLSSVKSLSAWDDYPYLPVVDRQRVLIGALARRTFRQLSVDTPLDSFRGPSLLASVAGAFFYSTVELSRVLVDLERPAEVVEDERRTMTGREPV